MNTILLCDGATRDAQTGKWSLGGIFDAVWAGSFPATHRALVVYFRVRPEGAGLLHLRCVVPDGTVATLAEINTTAPPRGVVEGTVEVNALGLPVAGQYRFEIVAGDAVLVETELTVAQLRPPATSLH